MRNGRSILAVSFTVAMLSPAMAAGADAAMKSMYMNPAEVKWGDAPPNLPKGAKIAVLFGDPGKAAPFVARLQVPANYRIPPHWHPTEESLTVISGSFYLGEGDKMDMKSGAHEVKAGGFHYLPAKAHHYAWSKGPAVIQINSVGPFEMTYIDPADDPSKKK